MSRRAWSTPDAPSGRPIAMVNQFGQPNTGHEIWVAETPLPIATLGRFTDFMSSHILPNGERTTLPVLSPEEVKKFMTPYNEWAPPPYNENRLPGDAAATRFSMCFTPMDDLLDMSSILSGNFQGLPTIDYDLEISRQRLWAGMPPLSSRRWTEKNLSAPENIDDLAVEHILHATDMAYFSIPRVSSAMRRAYNKAYAVLAHFDTVLAASSPNTTASTANLWADFFFTHVTFISTRIHLWASSHIDSIADSLLTRILSAPTTPGAATISPEQDSLINYFDNLTHCIRRVDETTLIPLVGFKNELPQWRHVTSPPMVNWNAYIAAHGAMGPLKGNWPADIEVRDEVYHQRVAFLVREELTAIRGVQTSGGAWGAEAVTAPLRAVRRAYERGRKELRGEERAVQEDMWVGVLRRRLEREEGGEWGFVAYRLVYGDEQEWEEFVRKFEADVNVWGEGVKGVEAVKEKVRIRWVDGREHGIAEGDVEGARRHFKSLQDREGLKGFITPRAFLVADRTCVDQYTSDSVLPGQDMIDTADSGRFIVVATDDKTQARDTSFDGTVRVLNSVLLDDVWPCLWWNHVKAEDMWNLARLHPVFVYVGPVVKSQIDGWEKFSKMKDDVLKKAAAWKAEERS